MKQKNLTALYLLLASILLTGPLVKVDAAEQSDMLPAAEEASDEKNEEAFYEEDLDFIYGRPMTEEEIAQQKSLEPQLEARIHTEPEPEPVTYAYRARSVLPQYYDSREYGYVTSVKDQGAFDMCWAFAIDSAAESSLIMNGISVGGEVSDTDNTDLSELHTAYYFYNRQTDPLNLTEGDKNIPQNGYDYRSNGGNLWMSALAFANWTGTESEQDAPYSWAYEDELSFVEEQQFSADAKLKNAYFINGEASQIKEAVRQFGSVAIMYNHDSRFYNYDTAAYCYPVGSPLYTSHAVAVVGWDDAYKKENFKPESGVTTDGAWIAKNSWGSAWGEEGYFYISYEEPTISCVTAMEFQSGDTYQYNYQYDGSSMTTANIADAGQKLANVFEVQGKTSKYEVLEAVSFALQSANVPYSIQIYTDLQSDQDPTSGTSVFETPLAGVTGYSGVHTVELPKTVQLMAGTKFSVVVSFSQNTAFYAERTTDSDYCEWVFAMASIGAGQSFWMNSNGVWKDLANSGMCARIKAYTNESADVGADRVAASAERSAENQILLEWTVHSGAEGYSVYRSTSEDGEYVCLGNVSGEQSVTYTDTDVEPGIQYYYRVKWYVTENDLMLESLSSNVVSAVTSLAVSEVTVSSVDYQSVTLAWEEADGADGCQVWRSTQKDGGYSLAAEIKSGTSYVDQLPLGTTYYFKIRMFRETDGHTVYSAYSDAVTAKPQMRQPALSGKSGGYNKVDLSWQKIEGAQGYRIYRSKSKNSGYSAIRNLTNPNTTSYSNVYLSGKETLKTGQTYYYKMRAFCTVGNVTVYSEYSEPVAVAPALEMPELTGKSWSYQKAALSWNKIPGVSGYRIYRSTKETSGFSAIRNLTNANTLSYTNSGLVTGKTYYYKMRAFRNEDGKTYYSAYSKVVEVKPVPNRVQISGVQAPSAGKMKISWARISGADGYRVYRAESSSGTYTYVRTLNGNSNVTYTDTIKKIKGKKYYYKVRAFRKTSDGLVFGWFSAAKWGTAK